VAPRNKRREPNVEQSDMLDAPDGSGAADAPWVTESVSARGFPGLRLLGGSHLGTSVESHL
jgi:hypothetical protein